MLTLNAVFFIPRLERIFHSASLGGIIIPTGIFACYTINTMYYLITCFLLLLSGSLFAQYKAVTYDHEKVVFGENQPLPAESHIMLQGTVQPHVGMVEVAILDQKGKDNRLPLYTNQWRRPEGSNKDIFMLPINFRLKSSTAYDVRINYYSPIDAVERQVLDSVLIGYIQLYLEQAIGINRNSLELKQNERQIIRSLNTIVYKGFQLYRNRTNTPFEGFSDLVRFKLKQIKTTSLNKGKVVFQDKDNKEAKVAYRQKLLRELYEMLQTELSQYLNLTWYKLTDNQYINDYNTEKGRRTIALQGGFGGAYISGTTQNLVIGASPFVGLAFPLSNRPAHSKFLNNLSITFGVFLLDFQGANNSVVSGPIFKRPTYVGLSYKLFRFVHLNAGATFLEDSNTAGQLSGIERRVFVRPFIGVSAQVDLWLDFSK